MSSVEKGGRARYTHCEDWLLIFLMRLCFDLICQFDDGFKVDIGLFLGSLLEEESVHWLAPFYSQYSAKSQGISEMHGELCTRSTHRVDGFSRFGRHDG